MVAPLFRCVQLYLPLPMNTYLFLTQFTIYPKLIESDMNDYFWLDRLLARADGSDDRIYLFKAT